MWESVDERHGLLSLCIRRSCILSSQVTKIIDVHRADTKADLSFSLFEHAVFFKRRGITSVTFWLLLRTVKPFQKGSTHKRKNLFLEKPFFLQELATIEKEGT